MADGSTVGTATFYEQGRRVGGSEAAFLGRDLPFGVARIVDEVIGRSVTECRSGGPEVPVTDRDSPTDWDAEVLEQLRRTHRDQQYRPNPPRRVCEVLHLFRKEWPV